MASIKTRSLASRNESSLSVTVYGAGMPCPSAVDRKSTRLNSSHVSISYAVFCLKKKIKADAAGGLLHLSSSSAALDFNSLFKKPLPLNTLSGDIQLLEQVSQGLLISTRLVLPRH